MEDTKDQGLVYKRSGFTDTCSVGLKQRKDENHCYREYHSTLHTTPWNYLAFN